jgi:hypothetical protein
MRICKYSKYGSAGVWDMEGSYEEVLTQERESQISEEIAGK